MCHAVASPVAFAWTGTADPVSCLCEHQYLGRCEREARVCVLLRVLRKLVRVYLARCASMSRSLVSFRREMMGVFFFLFFFGGGRGSLGLFCLNPRLRVLSLSPLFVLFLRGSPPLFLRPLSSGPSRLPARRDSVHLLEGRVPVRCARAVRRAVSPRRLLPAAGAVQREHRARQQVRDQGCSRRASGHDCDTISTTARMVGGRTDAFMLEVV